MVGSSPPYVIFSLNNIIQSIVLNITHKLMASDYIFPVWRVFFPLNYKLILNPVTSLTNALGNRLISQTQHGNPKALALISHPTRSLCVSIKTSALQAWLLGQATWCLSLTHTVFHYLLNPHGSPYAKHFSLSSSWLLPHVLVTTQPAVPLLLLGCQRVTLSQGKSQRWLPHLSMINKTSTNSPSSPGPGPSFTVC